MEFQPRGSKISFILPKNLSNGLLLFMAFLPEKICSFRGVTWVEEFSLLSISYGTPSVSTFSRISFEFVY